MTEQEIIEGIKHDNRQAMKEMYRLLAGRSMSTAMRYLADVEDSKDVVHDSFIKAFTHIDHFTYKSEGSLNAWLQRIVANESLKKLQKKSRITFIHGPLPEKSEETAPDIEEIPPNALMRMIGHLPTGYRTVLNLYVFEQKSHKEIAHLLGIKENSSASQFLRAKKMLAQMIDDYKKSHHDE